MHAVSDKYPFLKITNSVVWVRERTISTEPPPLVSEVSARFTDTRCHVVSVTDHFGHTSILGLIDRILYFIFQVAPQLYSRGWVDPLQAHYFSENTVAPGIELGPLDL
jgi:hypothetical protein